MLEVDVTPPDSLTTSTVVVFGTEDLGCTHPSEFEDSDDEETPDFRAGFGAFTDSDFAEQVETVGDELDRDFQESEQELFNDAEA